MAATCHRNPCSTLVPYFPMTTLAFRSVSLALLIIEITKSAVVISNYFISLYRNVLCRFLAYLSCLHCFVYILKHIKKWWTKWTSFVYWGLNNRFRVEHADSENVCNAIDIAKLVSHIFRLLLNHLKILSFIFLLLGCLLCVRWDIFRTGCVAGAYV